MASESLNLRAIVRDIGSTCADPTPAVVAALVLDALTPEQHEEALRIALPVFVRQVQSEERSRVVHVTSHRAGGGTTSTVSASTAAIRENWQQAMAQVVHLGRQGGSKRLRECTRSDLLVAASLRDEQAKSNRAKASEYRILANLLDEHGASTVAALPVEVLVATFGQAA